MGQKARGEESLFVNQMICLEEYSCLGCVGLCNVFCNRVWAKEENLKGVNFVDIVANMEEGGRLLDKSFYWV